jgi:hypothetical protein
MRRINIPGTFLPSTFLLGTLLLGAGWAQAQDSADEIQLYSPSELKELVAPIALYPDDLVAIVLPSSAYPLQLVQAERLLEDGGQPDVDWDESVVAAMNYPEVVDFLNEDLDWTYALGLAFINQEEQTFDAIQAFRADALAAGNLKSDSYQVVRVDGGIIHIEPRSEEEIYIPYYEPQHVIVRHVAPVYYYYPIARPIYYYPYPAHYSFRVNHFYGVGTYFSIGWHYGGLSLHYAHNTGHPYVGHFYSPRHYHFKPRVRHRHYAGKKHHYNRKHHYSKKHNYKPRKFARHAPRHAQPARHKARQAAYKPRKQTKTKAWKPRHQAAVKQRPAFKRHDSGYRKTGHTRSKQKRSEQKHVQKRAHKPVGKQSRQKMAKHSAENRQPKKAGNQKPHKAGSHKKLNSKASGQRMAGNKRMGNQRSSGSRASNNRASGNRSSGSRASGNRSRSGWGGGIR